MRRVVSGAKTVCVRRGGQRVGRRQVQSRDFPEISRELMGVCSAAC